MTRRLLIAGVGNLFLGDDAFGCEVTRRLKRSHPRPGAGIELRDFGVSVRALGSRLDGTYLLGCEPDCFEPSLHGICRLTPHVEAAAERCVALLHQLIEQPGRDLVALCLN